MAVSKACNVLPPRASPGGLLLLIGAVGGWGGRRTRLPFVRLKGPPGVDERFARPYLLAHLLIILLLVPITGALEDSPRLAKGVALAA